ncbi:MAG TPA: alcohol dehydrogenase catalytic domain-containing protein [Methylomirabilota bacterium]|jgi:2-desacetyl-2-hydroxyethyl bacteriochlorophyllide A dehydrogenase|nr:alcohol dehydrogenase catalytic domain-containing protein [Methylomirabilota bacterium]
MASKTMRASFYEGPGKFSTGSVPVPAPARGEALLRVKRVGICGTDLHIFQGHLDARVPRGGVIGHETFAEVAEAPKDSGFRAGDRVVVEPVVKCGACRACRMGASYLCYSLKVLGVDLPGGMREYYPVGTEHLLKVPDTLGDDAAAVIEPLAVATHDVTRAGVKRGDRVLVFGGGPIGTLIGLVCRERGAEVVVSEINEFRLGLLGTLGLQTIGRDRDPIKFVNDWTEGVGVDVAFEVTGNPAAVRLMTDVVRVWGTVSIVAIHSEPMLVNLYPMFARELTMHGSRLYTRAAWEEAIRLAGSGAVPLAPLVSRKIPLEALTEGMQAALGGANVMKILVEL